MERDKLLNLLDAIKDNDLNRVKSALTQDQFNGLGGVNFDIIRYTLKSETQWDVFHAVCNNYILQFNAYNFDASLMFSAYETFGSRNEKHFPKIPEFLHKCLNSNCIGAIQFVAIVSYFYNYENFKSRLNCLPQFSQQNVCRDIFEIFLRYKENFPRLNWDVKRMTHLFEHSKYVIDTMNSNGETLLLLSCKYNKKSFITYLLERGANKTLADNKGNLPETFAQKIIFEHNRKMLEQELAAILSTKDDITKKVM